MNRKPENDKYLQIPERCRLEEKIKGSKFIASAMPVTDDDGATTFVHEIKKEFHDATHNCWAWKIGMGRNHKYRYNDDGEPSGTAGQPILKAIDNLNITNICVVVTRYYGGTKLGTGGLMRAYSQTTTNLLRSCDPVKKYAADLVGFSVDFDFVNVAHVIIESFAAELADSHYGEKATFQVEVRSSKLTMFKEKLTEATNGQVEFK